MFRIIKRLIFLFLILSIGSTFLFKFVRVPFTPLMLIRYVANDNKTAFWKHQWIPIQEMPINIQKAVIASEDGNFTSHYGFDIKAIKKAWKHNEKTKVVRGGSTISQQTAKNVFLWPQKSYVRKGFEAYFTVLIELIWGKERIMEVYLNSIEMGENIYGIEAASQYWFNKSAKKLSDEEAAAIAAILPNPRVYKAKNSSSYIKKRKQHILKQMQFYRNPNYK